MPLTKIGTAVVDGDVDGFVAAFTKLRSSFTHYENLEFLFLAMEQVNLLGASEPSFITTICNQNVFSRVCSFLGMTECYKSLPLVSRVTWRFARYARTRILLLKDDNIHQRPYESIIECGIMKNGKRKFTMFSPFFGKNVCIYSADSDSEKRILFRSSLVAEKLGIPTSRIGMFLNRKKTTFPGIYQCLGFRNKPKGTCGMKRGGYFVTIEVCNLIDKHFQSLLARGGLEAATMGPPSKRPRYSSGEYGSPMEPTPAYVPPYGSTLMSNHPLSSIERSPGYYRSQGMYDMHPPSYPPPLPPANSSSSSSGSHMHAHSSPSSGMALSSQVPSQYSYYYLRDPSGVGVSLPPPPQHLSQATSSGSSEMVVDSSSNPAFSHPSHYVKMQQ